MNSDPTPEPNPAEPLTKEELAQQQYFKAVVYAGVLTTKERAWTEDNHGGALLHGEIPFGD